MSLVDDQKQLQDELSRLEKDRDKLRLKIIAKRKKLDAFIKDHGNIIHKERRDKEWSEKQKGFAEQRKDPVWQKWHANFMKNK